MSKRQVNDNTVGILFLLLFLLAICLMKGISSPSSWDSPPCDEQVFVQISGNIQWPGVYGFCQPPELLELWSRVGGIIQGTQKPLASNNILCRSGLNIHLRSDGHKTHFFKGEMSAFYKITLGIPISLNKENLEGLTAVPGIGPRIGGAIVRERAKRGGFKRLDEMLSIPGIGPTFYKKVARYLVL
ncbi:MAG: helix-hairpin-helix domain-containing protein [Desulfobacteraceae bacterium]|nr:MAG: helix-hairpin-helix domain-containing protein [Desulfobacteraceae bacterium]